MNADIVQLSDYVWQRTSNRLQGLSDEEYLWEPVPGGWSVRPAADGTYRADGGVGIDPPPVTNIAWRLWHLVACYGSGRNREWLGLSPQGGRAFEQADPVPATAEGALATLSAAHEEWAAVLASLPEAAWAEPLGPIAGPWAEADKAGFILHMVDEFIHHGAELALLRDLWRVRPS